jgi:uncharacterized protein
MPQRAHLLGLESFQLPPGGGMRVDVEVHVDALQLGGQEYRIGSGTGIGPDSVEATVDVSRTLSGFALRLRFEASLLGPCMRCLAEAKPVVSIDAREVEQPGESEELHTPYLDLVADDASDVGNARRYVESRSTTL